MTESEAKGFVQGKLDCMEKCDVFNREDKHRNNECDNCEYCYSQGTFGEQKEAFSVAINALEKQKKIKEAFEKWKAEPKVFIQLAEWLEELKDYRNKNKIVVRVDVENVDSIKDKIDELSKYAESQYNKAIDDFVKEICKMIIQSEKNGNYRFYAVEIKQAIVDLAEQLKAGGENV